MSAEEYAALKKFLGAFTKEQETQAGIDEREQDLLADMFDKIYNSDEAASA